MMAGTCLDRLPAEEDKLEDRMQEELEMNHNTQDAGARARWNIFARVLEDVLAAHGARIGQIDDRTSIHREKVARVQRSLDDPGRIHTLNPEELREVRIAFDLTGDEVLRLRAAMVAASIQKTLLDRISAEDARLAAEELYPSILDSLRRRAHELRGLGRIRGEP
jgi:hypothetical protein